MEKKVDEVKEVVKYVERLATQVEKAFVESTKNLQDFPVIKGRLEMLEENVKEMSKTLEGINARLENSATLKDLESFRTDLLSFKTQIDEINKVLSIVETKIPETIKRLREERDDILLLLKSLEEELKQGKISSQDYNNSKKKAMQKLRKIEDQLIEEWKKIEKFIESGGVEVIPGGETGEIEDKKVEENKEEKSEEKIKKEEAEEKSSLRKIEQEEAKLSKSIEVLSNQIEKSFSELIEGLKALRYLREKLELLENNLASELSENLKKNKRGSIEKRKSKTELKVQNKF